jgi:hypothetical protein
MRLAIFLLILASLAAFAVLRHHVARESQKAETISLIRQGPLISL